MRVSLQISDFVLAYQRSKPDRAALHAQWSALPPSKRGAYILRNMRFYSSKTAALSLRIRAFATASRLSFILFNRRFRHSENQRFDPKETALSPVKVGAVLVTNHWFLATRTIEFIPRRSVKIGTFVLTDNHVYRARFSSFRPALLFPYR